MSSIKKYSVYVAVAVAVITTPFSLPLLNASQTAREARPTSIF